MTREAKTPGLLCHWHVHYVMLDLLKRLWVLCHRHIEEINDLAFLKDLQAKLQYSITALSVQPKVQPQAITAVAL
jgi:hypothetical protein